jgi:hypothetical protein
MKARPIEMRHAQHKWPGQIAQTARASGGAWREKRLIIAGRQIHQSLADAAPQQIRGLAGRKIQRSARYKSEPQRV